MQKYLWIFEFYYFKVRFFILIYLLSLKEAIFSPLKLKYVKEIAYLWLLLQAWELEEWDINERNYFVSLKMASVGIPPNPGARDSTAHATAVDKLPEEMNDMKIRDDKVRFLL